MFLRRIVAIVKAIGVPALFTAALGGLIWLANVLTRTAKADVRAEIREELDPQIGRDEKEINQHAIELRDHETRLGEHDKFMDRFDRKLDQLLEFELEHHRRNR